MKTAKLMKMVEEQRWEEALQAVRDQVRWMLGQEKLQSFPMGCQEGDWLLARIGKAKSLDLGEADRTGEWSTAQVFVVTEIYLTGGHTPLIGDVVNALEASGLARREDCHVVLTDANLRGPLEGREALAERVGLPPEQLHWLEEPTLSGKLGELLRWLKQKRPQRAFLVQHPDDAVACAAALPEMAQSWHLVRHNDSVPSLGLYLPGMPVWDLSPRAKAISEVIGVESKWLPPTAPQTDGWQRPFLRHGRLMTACAGTGHKFGGMYPVSYAEVVARILKTTGGTHLHVGDLSEAQRAEIDGALTAAGVPIESFRHLERVKSITQTILDEGCDVFINSMVKPGLRTMVEVMGSGTPALWHSLSAGDDLFLTQSGPQGAPLWRGLEDLEAWLVVLNDPDVLAAHGRRLREHYERLYSPAKFAENLQRLLDGEDPMQDEQAAEREKLAQRQMSDVLMTLCTRTSQEDKLRALAERNRRLEDEVDQLKKRVEQFLYDEFPGQKKRIDHLQKKRRKVEDTMAKTIGKSGGRGLRSWLRRWLFK